jgi:hypothetical protein
MFHSDSLAFGPALTRAYDIESQIARVPRIVIDPEQLETVIDSPWTFDCRRRRRKIRDFPIVMKDRDGRHFLNFLTAEHQLSSRIAPEIGLPLQPELADPRRGIFSPARDVVAPQLTVVMLPLPFPVVVSAWVDVLGVWVQPKGAGGP